MLATEIMGTSSTARANTFIQMSDIQFGLFAKPLLYRALNVKWHGNQFEQETINFKAAIDFANKTKPSFVIISGDLTNDRGHEGQIGEFKRVARLLNPSIPLYLVNGNHDTSGKPNKERLANYRKNFGDDWYSFQHGDIYGIVLNSALIRNPVEAPVDAAIQREWLKRELVLANKVKAKHLFIFQHHPYFLLDPDEPSHYLNVNKPYREEYLELFELHGVEAIMTGHLHLNISGQYKNIQLITTGSVGSPNPLSISGSGLRVIKAKAEGLQHAYIALDNLF